MTDLPTIDAATHLKAMDDSVAMIDAIIASPADYDTPEGSAARVRANVEHLELMAGERVDELGESPDLSTYEAAIASGRAYLETN